MKAQPDLGAMRSQAGYTLVELSISVAIIAVLIVSGLVGVPRILDTNKNSTLTQQVTIAQANYSKLAAMNTNGGANTFATVSAAYSSSTVAPIANMGLWPDETVAKKGTTRYAITHPWGGFIYSKNMETALGTTLQIGEGYILKLEGVPQKQCFAVASAYAGTAAQILVDFSTTQTSGIIPTGTDPATTTNRLSVKDPGGSINFTSVGTHCGTNPDNAKTVYLWFPY